MHGYPVTLAAAFRWTPACFGSGTIAVASTNTTSSGAKTPRSSPTSPCRGAFPRRRLPRTSTMTTITSSALPWRTHAVHCRDDGSILPAGPSVWPTPLPAHPSPAIFNADHENDFIIADNIGTGHALMWMAPTCPTSPSRTACHRRQHLCVTTSPTTTPPNWPLAPRAALPCTTSSTPRAG
jgi:hypothetical protein